MAALRKKDPGGLKFRNRHRSEGRDGTSDSESEPPYMGKFKSVPTSTSQWDVYVLEGFGIYYNGNYHSSPLDILDLLHQKTGMFGPLTSEQIGPVKFLQDNITYSCSITEILKVVNMINVDTLIPDMKKDIDNIRNEQNSRFYFASVVEDFITKTRLMVNYQIAKITQATYIPKGPVPEDVFVDMFKVFATMCQLLPVPGSAWKTNMHIHGIEVKSESDVVVMTKDHLDIGRTGTVSVVSIVDVKNLTLYREESSLEEGETKTRSSESCDHDSEPSVHLEPAIFAKFGVKLLGQHGGELLLHHQLYGENLSSGQPLKYLPGMIVIGTEITFTMLALNADLISGLEGQGGASNKNKGYIYYSEPKDLLKKEDRDLLIESFFRLNNHPD